MFIHQQTANIISQHHFLLMIQFQTQLDLMSLLDNYSHVNEKYAMFKGQTLSAYTDKDLSPNSVSITEIVAI